MKLKVLKAITYFMPLVIVLGFLFYDLYSFGGIKSIIQYIALFVVVVLIAVSTIKALITIDEIKRGGDNNGK